jgi:hypothetical protein
MQNNMRIQKAFVLHYSTHFHPRFYYLLRDKVDLLFIEVYGSLNISHGLFQILCMIAVGTSSANPSTLLTQPSGKSRQAILQSSKVKLSLRTPGRHY